MGARTCAEVARRAEFGSGHRAPGDIVALVTRILLVVWAIGCGGASYSAKPTTTARGDGFEVECWDAMGNCDEGAKRSCASKKAIVIGTAEEKVGDRWKYKRIAVCRGS